MRLKLLFLTALLAATTTFVACVKEDDEEDLTEELDGVCADGYTHLSDAQLDAFCGAAYAYRCLDGKPLSNNQVQAVCAQYDDLKEPGVPACGFCK
ncbi:MULTISPECIES: hypothetical protein [unclassified Mucilaginibacter]|uniref:hypothetical protein n=1 Tax=unclassified Mucilaginibacter TaxID=2617802 RepID=UPI00138B653A|nr:MULTISPECIES: hypothetical protein [unclassified Mucilaginibacter]MBB5397348.1 hypothetical protein [Mucilaginibacter sp. AK015]QHS54933.1 hypothetical protein GWR56_05015 [Mucilaginibacter sp. 14171R-50]